MNTFPHDPAEEQEDEAFFMIDPVHRPDLNPETEISEEEEELYQAPSTPENGNTVAWD